MNGADIKTGSVVRYALVPQIFPRLKNLLGSGFLNLPYFIVVVFNTLKIIPDNHIYLKRSSHGNFSILQAMAAAANHIPFDKKNIDKITLFGVVLTGLVMMVMQILLLIIALFTGKAFAYNGPGLGPRTMGAFFDNPNTSEDLAFRLLDLVFGIPGIFNSKDAITTPFHEGLHALFQFYSFGMLLVATIIIVYLVMTIVMETAQSGVPFGKRFNKGWAPIRIVLFFGLLLPVPPHGINLAQYLLLNSAKLGSNLATNGWILFDSTSSTAYLGQPDQLIARPNTPDFTSFVSFMAIAKMCSWAEGRVNGYDIQPYIIYGNEASEFVLLNTNPSFSDMVARTQGGTIIFRFGMRDTAQYADQAGAVFPYCGELALPIVDQAQPGAAYLQTAYVDMIGCLWYGTPSPAFACSIGDRLNLIGEQFTKRYGTVLPHDPFPDMTLAMGQHLRTFILTSLNRNFEETITRAITEQTTSSGPDAANSYENPLIASYGWGGAGIWFNKIAQQNGAMTAALMNQPVINKMPYVMEYIRNQKLRQDNNVPFLETYTPFLSNGNAIILETPQQMDVAVILNQQFRYWGDERSMAFYINNPVSHNTGNTGNIIVDTMNLVMGTQGLFDMCKNTDIHPLAQLSSLGRGLIEHSIRSFGIATAVGIGGGIAGLFNQKAIADALSATTGFFIGIASIGLIGGIVLFYVLPMVPFIYFFFAVMTWVKSIFEAMVGMPLWALAHIRIDGEGMPGDSAESGYFYILEIFLRPVIIIISFMGAVVIFGAMVKVLNQIFYLVLSNLAGHTPGVSGSNCFNPPGGVAGAGIDETTYKRGTIDEFFYTIIYAVIVYMISMSCFKLVDLIPDRIMRWMGSSISSFGSQDGDPAEGLVKNVTAGAGIMGQKLKDGTAGFGFFR